MKQAALYSGIDFYSALTEMDKNRLAVPPLRLGGSQNIMDGVKTNSRRRLMRRYKNK